MIAASSVTSARRSASASRRRAQERRDRLARQASPSSSFRARRSSLPLDIIGTSSSARPRPAWAPCRPRAARGGGPAGRRRRRRRPRRRRPHQRRRRAGPRSASSTPTTWATQPGHLEDRGLDLAGRHVGPRGLDHVAAAAPEVEEARRRRRHEVAGAVPAVGVEGLVPLAAVRSPPSGTGPGTTARRLAGRSSPSARRTWASKPGTGRPNEPRRCSGWSPSSSLARHTLPASVMPSMLWRSSGSAGRTAVRHDRVEVAAADRRQVAAGEGRVRGQVGDRRRRSR